MIKINLYPSAKKRKKATLGLSIEKELSIYSILLLILGCCIFFINSKMNNEIARLTALKNKRQNENIILLKKLNISNSYKSKIEALQRKIEVIKKVRTKQNLSVLYLNELVKNFIENKLWFTSLSLDENSKMKISGVALDNHILAEYIQRLRKVKYYAQIDLIRASKENIEGFGLIKFDFNIQLKNENIQK